MANHHRGWLHLGDRGERLSAELSLNGGALVVSADAQLWEWAATEVEARLWDGAEFELRLDGERLMFYSENPLNFVFDFLPALEDAKRKRAPRGRNRPRRTPPARDGVSTADSRRAALTSRRLDAWTEVALGSTHNEVLRLLSQPRRRETTTHRHVWESEVGVCDECRQVLIDLNRLDTERERQ